MSTQQISPGPVLSRIWEIYRDQAPVLLGTAAILFVLQFVAYLVLGGAASISVAILFWVLSIVYQGMVVKLVQDVQDGRRDHSVGQLLVSVEPVLLALLAVSLLFAIGVGIGFVLLIIPGLFLLVIWSVVAPVTVVERPGVFRAFSRSQDLVRGHWWAVFGVIVIVYVAVLVLSLGVGVAANSLGPVGRALLNFAVTVVTAPAWALAASVLYFSLGGTGGTLSPASWAGPQPPEAGTEPAPPTGPRPTPGEAPTQPESPPPQPSASS